MAALCPMCGGEVALAPLPDLIVECQINEEGEDVLKALAQAGGRWLTTAELIDAIATGWDDHDQPDHIQGPKIVCNAVDEIRRKIPEIAILRAPQGWRLLLSTPPRFDTNGSGIECPCCGQ